MNIPVGYKSAEHYLSTLKTNLKMAENLAKHSVKKSDKDKYTALAAGLREEIKQIGDNKNG